MKRLFLLLTLASLLAMPGLLHAQAPDSLQDVVLDLNVLDSRFTPDFTARGCWLHADGTYETIVFTAYGDVELRKTHLHEKGLFTYTKTSASTARLTLATPPSTGAFLLTFDTPTSGGAVQDTSGTTATGASPGNPGGAFLFTRGGFTLRPAHHADGPINLSAHGRLATDASLTDGFAIGGTTKQYVLIRAVGPGLSSFGFANVPSSVGISLYRGNSLDSTQTGWFGPNDSPDAWSSLFALAGAFPLDRKNADSCLVVELDPGVYTAQAFLPPGATGGDVLLELYFLP